MQVRIFILDYYKIQKSKPVVVECKTSSFSGRKIKSQFDALIDNKQEHFLHSKKWR